MKFGTLLIKYRLRKGLSQEQVATCLKIDQATYSRLESDKLEPKASTLYLLAILYQISISELYPTSPQ